MFGMRPARFLSFFVLLSIAAVQAGALPLTIKELSLMLRGGDSTAIIMHELTERHFVDTLNPENETTLIKAGATPQLIAAMRSGAYSMSSEESAIAQKKIADASKRCAAGTEQPRNIQATAQDQAGQRSNAAPKPTFDSNATANYLKGYLVKLDHGSLVPVSESVIGNKKLIAYYFSAHWCGPCRKFTPQLVAYYNRVASQHPEFEIVFFSCDRSAGDMQNYMRETDMPWPAIDYARRNDKKEIMKAAGDGIPSLVLVESSGRMISSSFDGAKYRGVQKVLDDLDRIFGGAAPSQLAQARTN